MTEVAWTDTRIDSLKALWSDGLSASQIAAELGGVTRNAVIGKVHRLGLVGRARKHETKLLRVPVVRTPRPPRVPKARQRRSAFTGVDVGQPKPPTVVNTAPLDHSACAVGWPAFNHRRHCHWPIGEPADVKDFRFCGAPPEAADVYCARHAREAYPARKKS